MECPASPALLARKQAGALRCGFLVYSLTGLGVGTMLAGMLAASCGPPSSLQPPGR
jgi:hypothetical protein